MRWGAKVDIGHQYGELFVIFTQVSTKPSTRNISSAQSFSPKQVCCPDFPIHF